MLRLQQQRKRQRAAFQLLQAVAHPGSRVWDPQPRELAVHERLVFPEEELPAAQETAITSPFEIPGEPKGGLRLIAAAVLIQLDMRQPEHLLPRDPLGVPPNREAELSANQRRHEPCFPRNVFETEVP